jgi:hypothetical protein
LPNGTVIDDIDARLSGDWKPGHGLNGFVGEQYLYASANSGATARFEFKVATSGTYEVRVSHQPHENRSTKTPMTVHSADGDKSTTVNQRVEGPLNGYVSLGKYKFDANQIGYVAIEAKGADGNVHVDAVQILPAQ